MDYQAAFEKTSDAVRAVLHQPNLTLTSETKASHVQSWDSLVHTWIVLEIENRCGCRLEADKAMQVQCFGELVQLVLEASAAEAA